MSRLESIAIISTFATDRKIYEKTEVIEETPGGPMLFIKAALEKLGLKPEIFYGEQVLVEILVKENDELGKINEPKIKKPLPKITSNSAIVSTLLDEWSLTNVGEYKGQLFVDIQGYVRDGSTFGKKKAWEEIKELTPYIFCLKGNDLEIAQLPKEVVDDQKKDRMLIVTKGQRGVEIFYRGNSYNFVPKRIIKPKHTIGAGDTWFASFVAKFIETADVAKSAKFALDRTSDFLETLI